MLKKIDIQIQSAISDAFNRMQEKDYLSYILFISRADTIHALKRFNKTECVVNYQIDSYYDSTREGFYIRYLNHNYSKGNFYYEGVSGIDDLSIELMIYNHLWESSYFLKSLQRIASILCGKRYIWNPIIPDNGKWNYMHKQIINPLKESSNSLGSIVEYAYSSDIRNAFAHALYNIDVEKREIIIRPKTGIQTITFDNFQRKFLYSVILMNEIQNELEDRHLNACALNTYLTPSFFTPDGVKVRIRGDLIEINDSIFPRFSLVIV